MRTTPYPITLGRATKSPFKTVQNIRAVFARYRAGGSIGFTYLASLRSMGLIPRSHGGYELGPKYK